MEQIILGFDRALRTLTGQHRANRESPAAVLDAPEQPLSEEDSQHAAGLMRLCSGTL